MIKQRRKYRQHQPKEPDMATDTVWSGNIADLALSPAVERDLKEAIADADPNHHSDGQNNVLENLTSRINAKLGGRATEWDADKSNDAIVIEVLAGYWPWRA